MKIRKAPAITSWLELDLPSMHKKLQLNLLAKLGTLTVIALCICPYMTRARGGVARMQAMSTRGNNVTWFQLYVRITICMRTILKLSQIDVLNYYEHIWHRFSHLYHIQLSPDNSNLQGNLNWKTFELSMAKLLRKWPEGKANLLRVCGRFELSRVHAKLSVLDCVYISVIFSLTI